MHKPDAHCESACTSGRARGPPLTALSPPPGWMKVFALTRGVVGIKGVASGFYLCLGADGVARAAVRTRAGHMTRSTKHQFNPLNAAPTQWQLSYLVSMWLARVA